MLLKPMTGAVIVGVVATLAGCAGGSKSTSSVPAPTASAKTVGAGGEAPTPTNPITVATGHPLTQDQWIRQGDAICAALNQRLSTTKIRSEREFATMLAQAAAYERIELRDLARLVPPGSRRDDWQKLLSATQRWELDSAKLGEIAQARTNITTLPLAKEARYAHEELAALARRDGFKQCSLV